MTTSGYALGMLFLASYVGGGILVAVRVRRRIAPEWSGALSLLADVVLTSGVLIVVSEVLGTVNGLRRIPMVICIVVLALCVLRFTTRADVQPDEAPPLTSTERRQFAVAVGMTLTVFAEWGARTAISIRNGIADFDSLNYHLPFAARFAQDGATRALNFNIPGGNTTFHPGNSELVHAVGMIAFNRDFLSPLLNMLWLVAFFLACWCVGRPNGRAPLTLAIGALVAGTPLMAAVDAGSATNDIVALFFLVAAVAFLRDDASRFRNLFLAGLAAGLSAGTKVSMDVAIFAVTVVAIACASGDRRLRAGLLWLGSAAAGGSYWYLRNLFATGSPLPTAALSIGPIGFPKAEVPLIDRFGFSVKDYVTDGHFWRAVVEPGLGYAFGALWPLILGLSAIGIAAGLTRARSRLDGAFAIATAVIVAGYIATPTTAFGPPRTPDRFIFAINSRYVIPALLLGLFCLATSSALRRASLQWVALGVLATCALTSQSGNDVLPAWFPQYRPAGYGFGIAALAVAIGAWIIRTRTAARTCRLIVVGLIGVGLVASIAVGPRYANSYAVRRYGALATPFGDIYRWAQTLHNLASQSWGSLRSTRCTESISPIRCAISGGALHTVDCCESTTPRPWTLHSMPDTSTMSFSSRTVWKTRTTAHSSFLKRGSGSVLSRMPT